MLGEEIPNAKFISNSLPEEKKNSELNTLLPIE